VLSDSTEGYDRGSKFSLYRRLPSLREYLLVAQDRVSVELYTPSVDGRWMLSVFDGLDMRVHLPNIDCELSIADVYDRVQLDAANRSV